MNNLLWAEWSNVDEENAENIKFILEAFEGVISGLMVLDDYNYLFNNLNSSPSEKNYYHNVHEKYNDFIGLSEEFEKLRSVLFGGILDWDEIKRSLE